MKHKAVSYYKGNTLKQLRAFCSVARTGKMTDAADELFLSQSAISLQIKALEQEIDAILFEQELDTTRQSVGHFARATNHRRPVELKVIKREAKLLRPVSHRVVQFGVFQQCLGRDASPVQAGASGAICLNAGNFFSELGGTDPGNVAGRSASNNNQVVGHE
jgi:hypothetical protein